MEAFLNELIQSLGNAGVFGLMLFFAGELIMPLAGYLAYHGQLTLQGAVLAGTLGSSTGSIIIYYVARYINPATVHRLAGKYGRYVGITAAGTKRAEGWFDRHNRLSVLFGKLVPGVRSATSLVAGYRRMPLGWFVICTTLPSLLWTGVLGIAGYLLSDHYTSLQTAASKSSTIITMLLIVGLVIYLRWRRKATPR